MTPRPNPEGYGKGAPEGSFLGQPFGHRAPEEEDVFQTAEQARNIKTADEWNTPGEEA